MKSILILVTLSSIAFCQNITVSIKGIVKDINGTPIENAIVKLKKHSTINSITDASGNYRLDGSIASTGTKNNTLNKQFKPFIKNSMLTFHSTRKSATIEIFSSNGKKIKDIKLKDINTGINHIPIPTNDMRKGCYIIKLKTGNREHIIKFISIYQKSPSSISSINKINTKRQDFYNIVDTLIVSANGFKNACIEIQSYQSTLDVELVSESDIDLQIDFSKGTLTSYSIIYVTWIENSENYLQNLFICNRILGYTGNLDGEGAPYWQHNIYPKIDSSITAESGPDAVTGATQKQTDFTINKRIKDNSIRQFSLMFEIDRSFNRNAWFSDQPALLYSADINLDNDINEYILQPIGWTPNSHTENIIPGTENGILVNEMKYITHNKEGDTFGAPNSDQSCTNMVEQIKLTIIR